MSLLLLLRSSAVPNARASSLSDSFDGASLDTSKWTIGTAYQSASWPSGHSITQSGGDLVLTPTVNYASGSDSGLQCYANVPYDMTDDRFCVSINDLSVMPASEFIGFFLMNSALDEIGFKFQGGSIFYVANGLLTSIAFNPANHGWFCIDYLSATQFRLLIAPPSATAPARGDAAWVDNLGGWTFPGALAPTAVVPVFQVGSNNAIPAGSTATVGHIAAINAPTVAAATRRPYGYAFIIG